MKRIWIINHYAEPPDGGKYLRHFNFAKTLKSRGYDIDIFTASTIHRTNINKSVSGKTYTTENIEGVPFHFISTRSYNGNGLDRAMNMVDYFFGVQKAIKDFPAPDVIYTSGPHPLAWLAAKRIGKKTGAKLIVETRDLWPETFVAMGRLDKSNLLVKCLYRLEKNIYQEADELIFTMAGGKDYVSEIGIDTRKVHYINNGIKLEDFNENIEKYPYTNKLYSGYDGFKAVFTGAIGKANRVDSIIEAFKIIKDRGYEDLRLYLFGHGTEIEELKKLTESYGMDNVFFMGKVDKYYIPSILSQASLNILSLGHMPELFKYGLSPNKLFEYFASGVPTVSNVDCGYDLVEKYRVGISTQGQSNEALAEGILKFYNMPKEEYKEYSKNACLAAESYDFEILTDKLVEVIEK